MIKGPNKCLGRTIIKCSLCIYFLNHVFWYINDTFKIMSLMTLPLIWSNQMWNCISQFLKLVSIIWRSFPDDIGIIQMAQNRRT